MGDSYMITITFPHPIECKCIDYRNGETLTCENVIWLGFEYLKNKFGITQSDAPLCVPAFGLHVESGKDNVYLPLKYRFDSTNNKKQYSFRVRHRPPITGDENAAEILLSTVVGELFILQAVDDFLFKELGSDRITSELEESLLMDIATLAVIISNSLHKAESNYKPLSETFNLHHFHLWNYERKNFSPQLMRCIRKSQCFPNFLTYFMDHIFVYFNFKEWISSYVTENKPLGNLKIDFIQAVLDNYPDYCLEYYNVHVKRDQNNRDCTIHAAFDNGQFFLFMEKVKHFMIASKFY